MVEIEPHHPGKDSLPNTLSLAEHSYTQACPPNSIWSPLSTGVCALTCYKLLQWRYNYCWKRMGLGLELGINDEERYGWTKVVEVVSSCGKYEQFAIALRVECKGCFQPMKNDVWKCVLHDVIARSRLHYFLTLVSEFTYTHKYTISVLHFIPYPCILSYCMNLLLLLKAMHQIAIKYLT